MGDRVTREDVLSRFPLLQVLAGDGLKLSGTGNRRIAFCPFHKETDGSFNVTVDKELWQCFGCKKGGTVIDYFAFKQGKSPREVFKELVRLMDEGSDGFGPAKTGRVVAEYIYKDALGNEIAKKLRYDPKDFRMQRKVKTGKWMWGLGDVQRCLYNLPEILSSKEGQPIFICEGEKDCDNLGKCGFIATTNIDGAGKWMEGYTDTLVKRDVVLCGDNDETGKKHVAKVMESIDGKVKRLRIITVPAPDKDISDYLLRFGNRETQLAAVNTLLEKAAVVVQGATVPIRSMREMEESYVTSLVRESGYSFVGWLPSLSKVVRPLMPGDLVCLVASTGAGKTAFLQNMAFRAAPIPVLFFEMELSETLTFERFVAGAMKMTQGEVERRYRETGKLDWWEGEDRLSSIYTCAMGGLTTEKIREIVNRSELKMGQRPTLVMIDYAQLMDGQGDSRYEKLTSAMEDLKALAINTNTIVVCASQMQRPKDERNIEVGLYSGKESGQIENSCQLHLGAWRDKNDRGKLWIRVNKNTKGESGFTFACNFDGSRMTITESDTRTVIPADI